jgi:pimeloyl-ACP methyl ester carboxylesterase
MSTYILIHGAWHGAWCWEKVVPLLRQAGHQVITFDLPGHGQDKTPVAEVTLDLYVQRTSEVLATQREPVILVGHSTGGIVLSETAERYPTKIEKLVYLTAFLLQDGHSQGETAQNDRDAILVPNVVFDASGTSLSLPPEKLQEIFYADCADEDIARAKRLLVPHQAIKPLVTPIHVTAENFGRIPRVYIECLQDNAISPACQRQMYTALPCQNVFTLQTSHSPFLSAPEPLSRLLLSA